MFPLTFTVQWYSLQDRTGRIIFKLFDKDPSSFPGPLRAQVGLDGYGSLHLVGFLFALSDKRNDDVPDTELAL